MIYLLGCTHYNHFNIIKYCNRPFKDEIEMNNTMVNRHNITVSKDDTFIHLGDFSFGNANKWKDTLNRLNFNKAILIQGNHDSIEQQDAKGAGFSEIHRKYWLNNYGYNILLTHKPCITEYMLNDIKNANKDAEYDIRRSYNVITQTEYDKMNLNIHAHIHNNVREQLNKTDKHFNASADMINFTPISLNHIIHYMFGVGV